MLTLPRPDARAPGKRWGRFVSTCPGFVSERNLGASITHCTSGMRNHQTPLLFLQEILVVLMCCSKGAQYTSICEAAIELSSNTCRKGLLITISFRVSI